jgi:hypothetical protein
MKSPYRQIDGDEKFSSVQLLFTAMNGTRRGKEGETREDVMAASEGGRQAERSP